MNTHFASFHRASRYQIQQDYKDLKSAKYINELVGALPYIATILNKERQIIFSNKTLISKLGIDLDDILGMRTGEALKCIHSSTMKAGCGTSEHCQVCGAINAILKCQETGKTATDECRIRTSNGEGIDENLDLEVTATPFQWDDRQFILFAARDISSEKRKEVLERIFFHDVINTAGTLQGLVELLQQIKDPDKITRFVNLLATVSQDLTGEILNQKSLMDAENGELAVNKIKIYLKETIEHLVKEYQKHELALNRNIVIDPDFCEVTIQTDPVLLRRVLLNMVKNALESITPGETVRINCDIGSKTVAIHVRNPGVMTQAVQKQIFQRSFSTKGKGRGLGTYSMKLLGEKYLGGKISFSSKPEGGTEFTLQLPLPSR